MSITSRGNEWVDPINDCTGTPVAVRITSIVKREKEGEAANEVCGVGSVFEGPIVIIVNWANVQGKPINACGFSFGDVVIPITRLITRSNPNLRGVSAPGPSGQNGCPPYNVQRRPWLELQPQQPGQREQLLTRIKTWRRQNNWIFSRQASDGQSGLRGRREWSITRGKSNWIVLGCWCLPCAVMEDMTGMKIDIYTSVLDWFFVPKLLRTWKGSRSMSEGYKSQTRSSNRDDSSFRYMIWTRMSVWRWGSFNGSIPKEAVKKIERIDW